MHSRESLDKKDDKEQIEKESEPSTQRIEAFSDGVFAIAITLLILEIKIPHIQTLAPGQTLHAALVALWPFYLTYILSFVTIGIYWANHHYIFKLYTGTDHVFNLLNVLFLMCISFLPFPTAILGEYLIRGTERATAISFFCFGLFLPACSWSFMWLYASYRNRLIDPRLDGKFVRLLTLQYMMSDLLYTISFAASLWNASLGLFVAVGLTILYLLPPKKPVYTTAEN